MRTSKIRPIVISLFTHEDTILVAEGYDEHLSTKYYRPIGGGIEFGEHSSEALIREVREEINVEIHDLKHLCVIENHFTYNGEIGHEIVFVYDAKFEDITLYEKETFMGIEDNGQPYKLLRVQKEEFITKRLRLVPESLISLL